jgi:hypothetical protein
MFVGRDKHPSSAQNFLLKQVAARTEEKKELWKGEDGRVRAQATTALAITLVFHVGTQPDSEITFLAT